jgi:hypothetical protein
MSDQCASEAVVFLSFGLQVLVDRNFKEPWRCIRRTGTWKKPADGQACLKISRGKSGRRKLRVRSAVTVFENGVF